MNRLCALLWVAAAMTSPAVAQTTPAFPFTYYIHDTTGAVADYQLPSIYQFSSTPLGSSSHIVIKAINTSSTPAFMGDAFVTSSTTSTTQNPNFTVSGLAASTSVPVGGSLLFQINFTPTVTGPLTAYLQTSYQVQQGSCNFTSNTVSTQCPSGLNVSATLTGTATQPTFVLTYQGTGGSVTLVPNSTPVNFGNVVPGATFAITFTLENESTVALTVPAISVTLPTTYSASAFDLDTSHVPSSIAGGSSASFTITFEPGQSIGYTGSSLVIGSNTYPLEGFGATPPAVADISSLNVCYADSTGVQTDAVPATAIPFSLGSVSGANTLTLMIMNPASSYNAVAIPAISVSGSGFSLGTFALSSVPLSTGVCPIPSSSAATSLPASISPGYGLIFTITFAPSAYGTSTGNLTIGSSTSARVYPLTGTSTAPLASGISLSVSSSPLASQQQATVAVQLGAAAQVALTGSIAIAFVPSIQSITTDPAVLFLANNTLQLPISVASGAQTATYNGQSALGFQTGTTAGTITFTVNFPNTPAYTQSFTITPAAVQITSATAVQASPNLVVNITGYDNTYSAGALNFTFFDTSGNAYPAIAYNASSNFQNLFFGSTNTSGGAFSLQATFPVSGDITKIGSVAVSIANSIGQANTTQTFSQ